jgi:hypothetical protein
MDRGQTLSSISDAASIERVPLFANAHRFHATAVPVGPDDPSINQRVGRRMNRSVMMESEYKGPLNRFNRRLTEPSLDVHYLSSSNIGNLNPGDRVRHTPDLLAPFNRRSVRSDAYGPDTFLSPVRRNESIVEIFDPDHPINAMRSTHFATGGSSTTPFDPRRVTAGVGGAQGTTPSRLIDDAQGLDYTHYTSSGSTDFSSYERQAKQNFVKRMSEHVLVVK